MKKPIKRTLFLCLTLLLSGGIMTNSLVNASAYKQKITYMSLNQWTNVTNQSKQYYRLSIASSGYVQINFKNGTCKYPHLYNAKKKDVTEPYLEKAVIFEDATYYEHRIFPVSKGTYYFSYTYTTNSYQGETKSTKVKPTQVKITFMPLKNAKAITMKKTVKPAATMMGGLYKLKLNRFTRFHFNKKNIKECLVINTKDQEMQIFHNCLSKGTYYIIPYNVKKNARMSLIQDQWKDSFAYNKDNNSKKANKISLNKAYKGHIEAGTNNFDYYKFTLETQQSLNFVSKYTPINAALYKESDVRNGYTYRIFSKSATVDLRKGTYYLCVSSFTNLSEIPQTYCYQFTLKS